MKALLFLILSMPVFLFAQEKKCSIDLWEHVYHPDRLHVIKDCITVTGTVKKIKHERDGDWHINIQLDAAYTTQHLVNDYNELKQQGCLVVEIICVTAPKQTDAIQSCLAYDNTVNLPKKGDHVSVTGTYITDLEANHGWNEIHPVSSLVELNN